MRQQELREESRGAGLAYGGLQGYSFPQVIIYYIYTPSLRRLYTIDTLLPSGVLGSARLSVWVQVQQYNEYLRPLSRVHMCPEPVLSTMVV